MNILLIKMITVFCPRWQEAYVSTGSATTLPGGARWDVVVVVGGGGGVRSPLPSSSFPASPRSSFSSSSLPPSSWYHLNPPKSNWCHMKVEWSGPDHWNLAACASLAPVVSCHPGARFWKLSVFINLLRFKTNNMILHNSVTDSHQFIRRLEWR